MTDAHWLGLMGAIAVCEATGLLGALFTRSNIRGWYAGLRKPRLSPPNWLFAPVWTTLYALMGVSVWLAWSAGAGTPALAAFAAQLALNAVWSYLFFGRQSPAAGLVDIALLWLALATTIALFVQASSFAALLLVPYLLWVSFAMYLNWAIVKLN